MQEKMDGFEAIKEQWSYDIGKNILNDVQIS